MVVNKNGRGTARSTSWATTSAYKKQNDGEPGQTAGWSSRHYEDLMPCTEAGGVWKNTSNVPDCIRFATWNIGNMSGRSAEVGETLHRRKIYVCCVQETRWTGSGARVMGKGMSRYKIFWQGCKDGNAGVGLLISDRWIDKIIDVKRVNYDLNYDLN